jgi:hypothetical protein
MAKSKTVNVFDILSDSVAQIKNFEMTNMNCFINEIIKCLEEQCSDENIEFSPSHKENSTNNIIEELNQFEMYKK